MYELLLDGTHDKIDFSFEINGEHFSQLYYLVDGIYPLLSQFLSTVNDPTTALDCFFAPRQEGFRKSIERAFGVRKCKFLSIWCRVLLHHREDIFYLVRATIFVYNMMVEERIRSSDRESDEFYEVCNDASDDNESIQSTSDVNNNEKCKLVGDFDTFDIRDHLLKYKSIQQRWKTPYNTESSLQLQDAVKKYLYKKHFGKDASLEIIGMVDNYDPLIF